MALKESGIIDKKISDATRNTTTCLKKPGTETTQTIVVFGMKDLAGIFLVLGAGNTHYSKSLLILNLNVIIIFFNF